MRKSQGGKIIANGTCLIRLSPMRSKLQPSIFSSSNPSLSNYVIGKILPPPHLEHLFNSFIPNSFVIYGNKNKKAICHRKYLWQCSLNYIKTFFKSSYSWALFTLLPYANMKNYCFSQP